jgi:hypothetical protein
VLFRSLAQAIYISGRLSLGTNLPNNAATSVLVNNVPKQAEELPTYLTAQNADQDLNQVYSSTAANDGTALQATIATQTNSNVIYLTAHNTVDLYPSAELQANGTPGGSIYLTAPSINTQAGSVAQANGNNGPGGLIDFSGDQITVVGSIAANGTDGGAITMIANDGDLIIQNSVIQTNGSNGRGGSIALSATNNVTIEASSIEATGLNQGGSILIGNDANNGTLPFALVTSIDQDSYINAAQLDPSDENINGGFIETSGDVLNLLATINAGRGGMWLIDPTNVTISSAASTGGDLAAAQGQETTSNFNTTQIQTAINAGTSVTILVSGTITQTTALTFNVATAGLTPTLTLNNTSGSKQAITLIAITDNSTGSGSGVSVQAFSSGGAIKANGAINVKGSITLDNTYGAASGATPASGYITSSNAPTLATTTGAGINVGGALTAGGIITLNGVSHSATANHSGVISDVAIAGAGGVNIKGVTSNINAGVFLQLVGARITSSAGNISIDATSLGASNSGFINAVAAPLSASVGFVTITGRTVGGPSVNQSGLVTARSITVDGIASGNPTTNVTLGAMTISAGGSNISVTATSGTAGGNTGIYQTGTITGISGSSISFTSNNKIDQNGALTLAANASANAANITYDTSTGTRLSTIAGGTLTIAANTSSSAINYTAISAGANINPSLIGTTSIVLPGTITLDNTFGTVSGELVSGVVTASNASTAATTAIGVTIDNAIFASGNIAVNGVSSGNGVAGISYSAGITSTAGNVLLNGGATNGLGVYNLTA